ncbi:permease-like cell division protein FtsX [Burkholderiaceae bacterium DAT-1]|nr:permease-like cell division protein FtsX [Burkholderiaceae bacterium DAT-1]
MGHWLRLQINALRTSVRHLLRQPLATLMSLAMIAVAVALPLGLYMLLNSAASLAGRLPTTPELTVFVRQAALTSEVSRIDALLQQDANVARYRHVSKDEALKELEGGGMRDLVAGLGDNPLPESFVVTPKDTSAAAMKSLSERIHSDPSVDQVQFDSEWVLRLEAFVAAGREIVLTIAALVLLGLLLVTANLVRMQILTRIDEIEVSKLIGATDAFIRRPFLYFAAVQGILGAICGIALVVAGLGRLAEPVMRLARLYGEGFVLQTANVEVMLVTIGLVVVTSLVGAAISVRQHLRRFDA